LAACALLIRRRPSPPKDVASFSRPHCRTAEQHSARWPCRRPSHVPTAAAARSTSIQAAAMPSARAVVQVLENSIIVSDIQFEENAHGGSRAIGQLVLD
ncbi:hypothetical protein MTO96_047143, partial [Rhipicephalus appendiculatus]